MAGGINLLLSGDRELIMSTNPRSQNLQVAPRLLSGNGGI